MNLEKEDTFDVESAFPFAYGTFAQATKGVIPTLPGGENISGWNGSYSNNTNLLSPSFSRRSRSCRSKSGIGMGGGTLANNQRSVAQNNVDDGIFGALEISKFTIIYLTLLCMVLLANMTQMIVLYSSWKDRDELYVIIFYIFPFLCFIMLKINDIALCNDIAKLFEFGYYSIPTILNKYRRIIHAITFMGFPFLWIAYSVSMSNWIQNIQIKRNETFDHAVSNKVVNSVAIALWTIIQFIQFTLSIITLLYCIQHNINQQKPEIDHDKEAATNRKFSLSITNPFNSSTHNLYGTNNRNNNNNNATNDASNIHQNYVKKIHVLDKQIHNLQTELIKSRQENITTNSQISNDYNDELQERNQEFRAMLSERDLLKTELENKKSALTAKKQQCKQQLVSIKSLQQMREENILAINNLKKKLFQNKKELQKMQLLLQIEKQNVQKAQQYFDNFQQ